MGLKRHREDLTDRGHEVSDHTECAWGSVGPNDSHLFSRYVVMRMPLTAEPKPNLSHVPSTPTRG